MIQLRLRVVENCLLLPRIRSYIRTYSYRNSGLTWTEKTQSSEFKAIPNIIKYDDILIPF